MAEILHTRMGVITYLAPTGCIAEAEGLESLKETVASCVASREIKLVLDLDRVPALTSLALETLLDIQDRLTRLGGSLKVVNPNALVEDIFRATGLHGYIEVMSKADGRVV